MPVCISQSGLPGNKWGEIQRWERRGFKKVNLATPFVQGNYIRRPYRILHSKKRRRYVGRDAAAAMGLGDVLFFGRPTKSGVCVLTKSVTRSKQIMDGNWWINNCAILHCISKISWLAKDPKMLWLYVGDIFLTTALALMTHPSILRAFILVWTISSFFARFGIAFLCGG